MRLLFSAGIFELRLGIGRGVDRHLVVAAMINFMSLSGSAFSKTILKLIIMSMKRYCVWCEANELILYCFKIHDFDELSFQHSNPRSDYSCRVIDKG